MQKFFQKLLKLLPVVAIALLVWWHLQQSRGNLERVRLPPAPSSLQSSNCEVIAASIYEGDAMRVKCESRWGETTVGLCGIALPEKNQKPWGANARDYLREVIAKSNNKVTMVEVEKDCYGRTADEVWVFVETPEEELANALLVRAGLARLYPQQAKNCPNYEGIKEQEEYAKSQEAGLWSDRF